jgi:hypothetical protein
VAIAAASREPRQWPRSCWCSAIGRRERGIAETLTMTPRCTAILGAAAEIVRAMGHTYIGVEHLFLALAHDADAVPTQVLAEFVSVGRLHVEPA